MNDFLEFLIVAFGFVTGAFVLLVLAAIALCVMFLPV